MSKKTRTDQSDGDLSSIGRALDEISWDWLSNNFPQLAEAIQYEADQGAGPSRVRRYVMRKTQRYELALRCEQAARHLLLETAE